MERSTHGVKDVTKPGAGSCAKKLDSVEQCCCRCVKGSSLAVAGDPGTRTAEVRSIMEHGRAPLIWNPDINKGVSLVHYLFSHSATTHSELRCCRLAYEMPLKSPKDAWRLSSCTSQACCLGCCVLCAGAAFVLSMCTHRDRVHRGGAEGEGVCHASSLLSPLHQTVQELASEALRSVLLRNVPQLYLHIYLV